MKKARGGSQWRKRASTLTRPLEVGDKVRWWDGRRHYQGRVIQVVQPNEPVNLPKQRLFGSRPETSYLVERTVSKKGLIKLFWPRAHFLELDEN